MQCNIKMLMFFAKTFDNVGDHVGGCGPVRLNFPGPVRQASPTLQNGLIRSFEIYSNDRRIQNKNKLENSKLINIPKL